jgi:hypothetical protein
MVFALGGFLKNPLMNLARTSCSLQALPFGPPTWKGVLFAWSTSTDSYRKVQIAVVILAIASLLVWLPSHKIVDIFKKLMAILGISIIVMYCTQLGELSKPWIIENRLNGCFTAIFTSLHVWCFLLGYLLAEVYVAGFESLLGRGRKEVQA